MKLFSSPLIYFLILFILLCLVYYATANMGDVEGFTTADVDNVYDNSIKTAPAGCEAIRKQSVEMNNRLKDILPKIIDSKFFKNLSINNPDFPCLVTSLNDITNENKQLIITVIDKVNAFLTSLKMKLQELSGQAPGQAPAQVPGQAPPQAPSQVPGQAPAQVPPQVPGQAVGPAPSVTISTLFAKPFMTI